MNRHRELAHNLGSVRPVPSNNQKMNSSDSEDDAPLISRFGGGGGAYQKSGPTSTSAAANNSNYSAAHYQNVNASGALVPAANTSTMARGSDLRDLLLNTEREMADLREECSLRGSELQTLKAALQREHESTLRLQTRHANELDDTREEYDRQQGQLVEQVTVLKGLCESALQDKHRVTDEAQKAKINLLQLIEKEREEKSQVMAEYRQQTETLIAEQGREITGLRQLLEMARVEEDKLLGVISANDGRAKELEGDILKGESAISDERLLTQRKYREIDLRHAQEMQAEKDRASGVEQQLRSEITRLNTTKVSQTDAVTSLTERLKVLEQQFEQERRRLKDSYQADLGKAREELLALKERFDRDNEAHRREVDKLQTQEESVTTALRRNLDTLRSEKVADAEEFRLQREAIAAEFQSKLNAAKVNVDSLERDITDERAGRREAESKLKSLLVDKEALQSTVNRLTAELEELQVTARTRERQLEQEHLRALGSKEDELRDADSDNTLLRHQLKKVDMELQRLLDEVETKQRAIEQLRGERNKDREQYRADADRQQAAYDDYRRQSTKALDNLHGQKIQLETEVNRLQRLQGETESRLTAANKQLADERKALERSIGDAQQLRGENGDIRAQVDRTNKLNGELSSVLGEKEETLLAQDRHITEMGEAMLAAKEQLERERTEGKKRVRDYEEAVSSLHAAGRLQMEKAEAELHSTTENLRHARDTIKSLEEASRSQREEVSHWQRECSSRDETHGESIRQLRVQCDAELNRMDDIINHIREDLAKAQAAKAAALREVSDAQRDADRRVAIVQEALETERNSKLRLHDELRNKEQLNAELSGTVRLINSRLASKDDEIHKLEHEVSEQMRKLHDTHSSIGKKDAIIGQLNAKLRVFEHSQTLAIR
eukprot:GILI01023735.1.p1 GENE.GILI01023735.1~~GILI01023735.1.p1  ORF type:complete len:901 (+),score=259.67 GILI01023735.1:208-2910(+)